MGRKNSLAKNSIQMLCVMQRTKHYKKRPHTFLYEIFSLSTLTIQCTDYNMREVGLSVGLLSDFSRTI